MENQLCCLAQNKLIKREKRVQPETMHLQISLIGKFLVRFTIIFQSRGFQVLRSPNPWIILNREGPKIVIKSTSCQWYSAKPFQSQYRDQLLQWAAKINALFHLFKRNRVQAFSRIFFRRKKQALVFVFLKRLENSCSQISYFLFEDPLFFSTTMRPIRALGMCGS